MIGACSTESILIPVLSSRNGYGSKAILPSHANQMFIHTQTLTKNTAAIMNFQLPPNSAMRSAARSERVSCAASSTLPLRAPVWGRRKHSSPEIWVAAHKGKKILARKHSQPRVFRNPRVGRARLTTEQGH